MFKLIINMFFFVILAIFHNFAKVTKHRTTWAYQRLKFVV